MTSPQLIQSLPPPPQPPPQRQPHASFPSTTPRLPDLAPHHRPTTPHTLVQFLTDPASPWVQVTSTTTTNITAAARHGHEHGSSSSSFAYQDVVGRWLVPSLVAVFRGVEQVQGQLQGQGQLQVEKERQGGGNGSGNGNGNGNGKAREKGLEAVDWLCRRVLGGAAAAAAGGASAAAGGAGGGAVGEGTGEGRKGWGLVGLWAM